MAIQIVLVSVMIIFGTVYSQVLMNQEMLDAMARTLRIEWNVISNTDDVDTFKTTLTLTNDGDSTVAHGNWIIYFYSIYPLEPGNISPGSSYVIPGQGLEVMFINGMLYKMWPTSNFTDLLPGHKRIIRLTVSFWSVARTDFHPNWYIVGPPGTEPRIIESTAGEDLKFVSRLSTVQQLKRYDFDEYAGFSAQQRYARNYVPYDDQSDVLRVIPKPLQVQVSEGSSANLSTSWVIYDNSTNNLSNIVSYLQGKLTNLVINNSTPISNAIVLMTGDVTIKDYPELSQSPDAYSLTVNPVSSMITIIGRNHSGVFYGVQTLLSLMRSDGTLPVVTVYDAPRFSYRSVFLDIARNFRTPTEIKRLLDVVAMYKLNKLHLHLSDDEGWRIEISGLPELTELGSNRCQDEREETCLLPQLGSGPFRNNSGSGFLSVQEYQDILRKAQSLYIEVIPEIDMPGHARAPIKSMEKRYRNTSNTTEALKYRLIEENDTSVYSSAQTFNDNAINVCLDSTYTFISKVVTELQNLHASIQPLRMFHVGGDEVGKGAWEKSENCSHLKQSDVIANTSLKEYFFKRVAEIIQARNISAVGAWEDGLMIEGNQPFNRSIASNIEVFANVWDNVWEWGTSPRTHMLANMGYKVVMSQATHLYFDHPYEPDPEERGYYWATRYTDTKKAFGFMPMAYYENIEEQRSGQPLTKEEICGTNNENCPELLRKENIVGMQGHLFSETSRTRDQVESQLFPRLLALAERSWHEASWEQEPDVAIRTEMKMKDWYSFARAIGNRELPRLDALGIHYRIPPPGAKVQNQRLYVTTLYPGLSIEWSKDSGDTWQPADGTERIEQDDRVLLRTRSLDGKRYSRTIELIPEPELQATPQRVLDYIASSLHVRFQVADNFLKYGTTYYEAKLFLNNTGNQSIPEGNWGIYFPSVQWVEPNTLSNGEFILQKHQMAVSHFQGYLFRIGPVRGFQPIMSGESREIVLRIGFWSVSRYEQFPNYYVAAESCTARVIANTATESLNFVDDFSKPEQWKRDLTDRFNPYTPSQRYGKYSDTKDLGRAPLPYLPTPKDFDMDKSVNVSVAEGWSVVTNDGLLDNVTTLLTEYFNVSRHTSGSEPRNRYISLRLSSEYQSLTDGAYTLSVNPAEEQINISARNVTGVLYGVQSLINMALQSQDKVTVFKVNVKDEPRFAYRGMHLDVARNFVSKETVLKMLEVMGLYKLNKFHFHLSDDEGWRLEIPGLPELTTLGSTRCHDPTEERCLVPVLGSGPVPANPGTGFYTVSDYKEILEYAAKRHIEVIPEFDMPGHARAAIKAMTLRRRLYMEADDVTSANQFALDELGDQSLYSSVQLFDDNAVNPCLDSTYTFIEHVMRQLKMMHNDINPLKTYHFGGDEVPRGAWLESKACQSYLRQGVNLKHMFSTRVASIAANLTLNVRAWEDGLMNGTTPFPRQDMATADVYTNAWDNVWEWGAAARAYNLANSGYKVIMSQATHLFFDHPYEPDPEERGFYWATRFTDTRKAFLFQPEELWNNIDINRMGAPLSLADVCGSNGTECPQLQHKENIIGMQGQLWAETIRRPEHLHYMLFPRLLALAERAWHRADWETTNSSTSKVDDWIKFANTLGHAQLSVLDHLNVTYRIPLPGAQFLTNTLEVNTEFPGLQIEHSFDGINWISKTTGSDLKDGQIIHLRTRSADGLRHSRVITTTITAITIPHTVVTTARTSPTVVVGSATQPIISMLTLVTMILMFFLYK